MTNVSGDAADCRTPACTAPRRMKTEHGRGAATLIQQRAYHALPVCIVGGAADRRDRRLVKCALLNPVICTDSGKSRQQLQIERSADSAGTVTAWRACLKKPHENDVGLTSMSRVLVIDHDLTVRTAVETAPHQGHEPTRPAPVPPPSPAAIGFTSRIALLPAAVIANRLRADRQRGESRKRHPCRGSW